MSTKSKNTTKSSNTMSSSKKSAQKKPAQKKASANILLEELIAMVHLEVKAVLT